jgi:hypothetical protein
MWPFRRKPYVNTDGLEKAFRDLAAAIEDVGKARRRKRSQDALMRALNTPIVKTRRKRR